MTTGGDAARLRPGQTARVLPKRFYKAASAGAAPEGAGFHVLLDGRGMRTPAKAALVVPTLALAQAIAAEWQAQGEHIEPATMPLTRLVNSAIDGVRGREGEVRAEIVKYAASDLLCYRAGEPAGLAQRQGELWDPVLAWSRGTFGARFVVAEGVMPVLQPQEASAAIAAALDGLDALRLAAMHVMTSLTGSALLALAHARGRLSAEAAWTAAHVDEDWQIARWGEDAEASRRRRQRWDEMQAASRLLALLG